jgi:hypothetical protein
MKGFLMSVMSSKQNPSDVAINPSIDDQSIPVSVITLRQQGDQNSAVPT